MKKYIFLALLIFSPLCAQVPWLDLSSQQVHFDGKNLSFEGKTGINHSLGKLKANKFSFPTTDSKKDLFSKLIMEGDVEFTTKDGSLLSCNKAEIDHHAMCGTFVGNPVRYVGYWYDTTNQTQKPLSLDGMQISVLIDQAKNKSLFLREIKAKDQVTIAYNDDLQMKADNAIYKTVESSENKSFFSNGILFLQGKDKNEPCIISNKSGDSIQSEEMTLDIISGVMQFKNVHGYIRFPNSLGQTKPVQFNAGTLIWNEKKNRLTLQDHVSIVSDPFGTLTTEGKVELELKDVNGQMILEKLIVDGNSSSVVQPNTQYSMNIQCNGHVEVNHSKKTITMQSPSQVEIKTDTGILSSDKITLNYSLEEDRFVPKYTVLEGNVKLRNHIMVDVRRPGPLDQYALADRVVIDLPTDTFVLSGVNGKRILFYDRINNLKMSAPEITVSKDPQTHKQVVKGKGDVRFTFLENEYDLLKRSFR